jgi:hypothetical protein
MSENPPEGDAGDAGRGVPDAACLAITADLHSVARLSQRDP